MILDSVLLAEVENFHGFPTRILGPELTISKIDLSHCPRTEEPEMADTVIVATGASAKRLGLRGEETYWQSEMSACALRASKIIAKRLINNLKIAGSEKDLVVNGLFYAIVTNPQQLSFRTQLQTDPDEYVVTVPGTTQTSVRSVFAAGDLPDKG
ncbi:hypothetical protein K435DRAFT_827111 [Dendrothele bispora CBS 962.96]|uniref:FAD/NAD(P)-binding domain-containing protein n=1 Tax=Dendrothele bispora (strain CBS 962.96) TaxID=1314807 RepID=A0A4S8MKR8_DENBC|nr:hypothetical protein K435DRAFT_827111 [Dendrothele bispora CBS 962.96]